MIDYDRAAALLRAGRLVAFPTETVYGLGANALDAAAVQRIYEAKGRPSTSPLIVHVADAAMAKTVAAEWPEAAERLAARFWPGPLTLVLPKRRAVPDEVTAGLGTVGVRQPAHPVALELIRRAGVPLAGPSANRFMGLSPTTAEHVRLALGEAVEAELMDEYVGGGKGLAERAQWETYMAAHPRSRERLAVARGLDRKFGGRRYAWWMGALAAAAVLLVCLWVGATQ